MEWAVIDANVRRHGGLSRLRTQEGCDTNAASQRYYEVEGNLLSGWGWSWIHIRVYWKASTRIMQDFSILGTLKLPHFAYASASLSKSFTVFCLP